MTPQEIKFQVALSCIQGVLEAKHGIFGEIVPSVAVAESLRIADEFVKQWYSKTVGLPDGLEDIAKAEKETIERASHWWKNHLTGIIGEGLTDLVMEEFRKEMEDK